MKKISVNNIDYEIIEDVRNAIDLSVLNEKITDYFDSYDYIVGDWAYGKLRLKGFNDKSNKNYSKINAYESVQNYIKDYCAYGCKYFIIKRLINTSNHDKI